MILTKKTQLVVVYIQHIYSIYRKATQCYTAEDYKRKRSTVKGQATSAQSAFMSFNLIKVVSTVFIPNYK